MNQTLLSIVIPAYNAAKTIKETLNSVVIQKADGVECIVIDGQSEDATPGILKSYSDRYPFIRFISEPDKGIYDAMNKGIRLAKGNYLYFLGSDDTFYNERVLSKLFAHPYFGNIDCIYGDVLFKGNRARVGEEKNYLKLFKDLDNICHQSVFYSKSVFEKLGHYNLNYQIYADFEMNIRCFREESLTKKYINEIICVFNEKGTSYFQRSRDRFIIELHEEYVHTHEDAVSMYDTIQQLEAKLTMVMNSKEYRLGKKIGDGVRRFKGLFNHFGI